MSDKVILRATFTWIYEADPKNYGTNDPDEMAGIDQAQDDILAMVDSALDEPYWEFSVKEVTHE
jgi:hypothetical protein